MPKKKSYDQPRQHIKKQGHYFANKGPSSLSYGFPVVMYGCESWTIKKAECRRIGAFELWCWRRLLRVPWTVRRSNQSILKEISPEYSLGGLMLKLKLQSFGHLIRRIDSFEKTLMLEKIEGGRRRGWQDKMAGWHHQLNGHESEQALRVCDGQGGLACCSPWDCKESDMTERLNWTELNWRECWGHLVLLINFAYKKWSDMLKVRWLINYTIEWTRTMNPDFCLRAVSMTSCSLIWLTDSCLRGSIPCLVYFNLGG